MSENDAEEAFVETTRQAVASSGAGSLVVSNLNDNDIPHIWWAGNPGHIEGIAAGLARVPAGDVDYLAVRAPTGEPAAVGRITYTPDKDSPEIGQLTTHWQLQGIGLATRLISVAEERIRQRGRTKSVIGVEHTSTRIRSLYERLGYQAYGSEQSSWEVTEEDGSTRLHTIDCVMLEKHLT